MDERRDLIPASVREIKLTRTQQEEIAKQATKYLAEKRIPLDKKEILQAAFRVVSDALIRGLSNHNKLLPTENEKVVPYIKAGLEQRETIVGTARRYLDVIRGANSTYSEFTGALAVPKSLFLACHDEIQNTYLLPEIASLENFSNLAATREHAINKLATKGLSSLPKGLSEVGIERFPTFEERAKIVRNMISSYVFRGTLSPFIAIDDLKRMVFASSISQNIFSDERFQKLATELDISNEADLDAAKAFFSQTKGLFSSITSIPLDKQEKESDIFYTHFGRDLLLLHPALEEERIITSPEKMRATPGVPSIWDQGMKVGNLLIPQPDRLQQAVRQASARGHQIEAVRLQRAISAWRWLEKEEPQLKGKIIRAEERLAQLNSLIILVREGAELPKDAFHVIYTDQAKAKEKTAYREKLAQNVRKIIEANTKERLAVDRYGEHLSLKYEGGLPDLVEMPNIVLIKNMNTQVGLTKSKIKELRRNLRVYDKALLFDQFWGKGFSARTLSLANVGSSKVIADALEANQTLIEDIREGSVDVEVLFRQQIGYIFKRYRSWTLMDQSKKRAIPAEIMEWITKWKQVVSKRANLSNETKTDMILSLAETRNKILHSSLRHARNADKHNEKIKILDQMITEIGTCDPGGLSDRLWDRQQAQEYIQRVEASVPNIQDMDKKEVAKVSTQGKVALRYIHLDTFGDGELLPTICPNTSSVLIYLNMKLNKLSSVVARNTDKISRLIETFKVNESDEEKEKVLKMYNDIVSTITNQEKSYKWGVELAKILQHPLFSLDNCEGLPTRIALNALYERASVAKALSEVEELDELTNEARSYYLGIVRSIYTTSLERKIFSQEELIRKLKATGLQQELAAKIEQIGLAIKLA